MTQSHPMPDGEAVTFLCGADGLMIDVAPPGEHEWIAERWNAWADAHRVGTGEPPSPEAQVEFVARASEHYRAVVWPEREAVARRRGMMRASVRATAPEVPHV